MVIGKKMLVSCYEWERLAQENKRLTAKVEKLEREISQHQLEWRIKDKSYAYLAKLYYTLADQFPSVAKAMRELEGHTEEADAQ